MHSTAPDVKKHDKAKRTLYKAVMMQSKGIFRGSKEAGRGYIGGNVTGKANGA
jgi:hypothetical protein